MKKIAITGHRHLLDSVTTADQIALSIDYFLLCHTRLQAISAMAAGSDTLFAELVLKRGIPLQVFLPFPQEEYRKDFSAEEWESVEKVLRHPNCSITLLSTALPASADERKNAYVQTGQRLIQEADILLAVWDGQPPQGKGGTADVVAMANKSGKEVHLIKAMRHAEEGEQPLHDSLQHDFKKEDDDAKRFKNRRFIPAWWGGISTGVLAALSFAGGIAIKLGEAPGSHQWHTVKFLLGLAEVLLIILSLCLLLLVARRAKNNFLNHRRNAEFLRALRWFRNAGIPVQASPPDTGEKNKVTIKDSYQLPLPGSRITHIPHAARMTWILATEQSVYHQGRKKKFGDLLHRAETTLLIIRLIFFAFMLSNFILECIEYRNGHLSAGLHALQPWLVLGWMAMPPFYAAIEGMKYFSEWEKHLEKSKKMIEEFNRIGTEVKNSEDETLITTKAGELYTVMSLENSSWSDWWKERHPVPGI